MHRILLGLILLAFVLPDLSAQDSREGSIEGRLLEILRRRGVITDPEFEELRSLEAGLRKDADLETAVTREVGHLAARLEDDRRRLSYTPGSGFNFRSVDGCFSMTIGGRIQVRATYSARENVNGNENPEDLQDITVQRARIWFKGFAFDPTLKYELQVDVAGSLARPFDSTGTAFDASETSANRLAEVKFAYVDWQVCPARPWYNVKGGLFKAPYSRQQLLSGDKVEFVDRAPIDPAFAPSYAYGVMLWGECGGCKDDLFEYYAGIFDGPGVTGVPEGLNIDNNDNGLMYVARVAVNPFGQLPYSEADLRPRRDSHKVLLAIAANAWYHQDNNRNAVLHNFDDWSVGADAALAWRGLFAASEFHYRNDAQPTANPDVTVLGWNAEVGYMVVPERFELGLRYSAVAWNHTTAAGIPTVPTNSASREYLLLLAYYWHGHDMKVQLDFGRNEQHFADDDNGPNKSNVDEWRGRLQFQIAF